FKQLGYKFSSVLTITAPELDSMPLGGVVFKGLEAHRLGAQIQDRKTIYWIGDGVKYPYPNLDVYNSWNLRNNFSTVLPANSADSSIPVGSSIPKRLICGR